MNARSETIGSIAQSDVAQHGVKALQRGKDKLMVDLKAVVDDAQALMKEAVDTSAEGIAGVPAYLEDRLSTVKDNLHRAKDAIESNAKHAATATDAYVRENPWKSLGFVTAASVLLGMVLVSACTSATAKKGGN